MKKDIDLKKRFQRNLVQSIIGLILLGFAFNYLQTKDSEKRAFFGGFEVIYQKLYLGYMQIADPTRATILSAQYDMEKSLTEIQTMLESCNPSSPINADLDALVTDVKNMSLQQFSNSASDISTKRAQIYESASLECQKDSASSSSTS